MLGVIAVRPFATPLLNCGLQGLAHLPLLVKQSIEQTSLPAVLPPCTPYVSSVM